LPEYYVNICYISVKKRTLSAGFLGIKMQYSVIFS